MMRPSCFVVVGNVLRIVGFVSIAALAGCKVQVSGTAAAGGHGGAELDGDASVDESHPMEGAVEWHRCGDELVFDDGEINFATGSAELEGDRTEKTLQSLARFLREHPEVALDIEGHTDSRASAAYNLKLSNKRARALQDWLGDHGVPEDRLVSHGYGKDRPRVDEPEECRDQRTDRAPEWCEHRYWRHNRRTEFHVTSGLETVADMCADGSSAAAEAGLHGDGEAAAPGLWPGFYLYGSPGLVSVPLGGPADVRGTAYQWGLGVGYLWRPGARRRGFVALGAGLEHAVFRYENAPDETARAHDLRVLAELRVGGGSGRLVGYGMLTPGLGLGFGSDDGTAPGFAIGLGAGLWGLVWRGLFLGAEAGIDPVFYATSTSPHDGPVVGLDVRALIGWHFGWRGR